MVINDKLKGNYYRAPLTKLASRRNVENQFNELIDYFNTISDRLNECFDKITDDRESMKDILLRIYEKTLHFKYIIEHFHFEVDQHITEKLNNIINTFTSNISNYITPYDMNLFNHKCLTDDAINNQAEADTMEEWDRSVNSLSNSLGIRWFGGKLKDSDILTKLSNLLHITKINTYEGKANEDYINSNLILELFIYTNKGIAWLVLGQNATFGYNLIVKYISPDMEMNVKLLSKTHNVNKEYDLNCVDMDVILSDFIDPEGDNGDVYIKICTNIPSNTEAGKEGYFLSDDPNFNSYEIKKNIINFGKGLVYRDNKDVGYMKREFDSLLDINDKAIPKIVTPNLLSPSIQKTTVISSDNNLKSYYSYIILNSKKNKLNIQSKTFNPNNDEMSDLSDKVNGVVIDNSEIVLNKSYIDNNKLNSKYSYLPKLLKGEQNVDLEDYRSLGDISLLNNNEISLKLDTIDNSKSEVINNDMICGTGLADKTIVNKSMNNDTLEVVDDIVFENLKTKIFETENTDFNINDTYTHELVNLFGTNDGLYILRNGYDRLNKISDLRINKFIEYKNKLYICSNKGIYGFNFETNTLIPTNVISGEIVAFYIGNDGLLYAFRKCNGDDVYIRREDDTYGPNKKSLIDFIFVLYNNIWYELTDYAKNILGLTGSQYDIGTFNNDVIDAFLPIEKNYQHVKTIKPYIDVDDFTNKCGYSVKKVISIDDMTFFIINFSLIYKESNNGCYNYLAYMSEDNVLTMAKDVNNEFVIIDETINNIIRKSNGIFITTDIINNKIYYSSDGKIWDYNVLSDDIIDIDKIKIMLLFNGRIIFYHTNSDSKIHYSDDNGITWNYSKLNGSNFNGNIKNIVRLSNNKLICYYHVSQTGFDNVCYSDDNGTTWNNGTLNGGNINGNISDIIELSNGRIIGYYTNTNYGKIYYSNDNGATWNYSKLNGSNFNGYISDIIELSNGNLICYCANSNITTYIYYSDDNGATWNYSKKPNGSIFGTYFTKVIKLSNDVLLFETHIGNTYRSRDGGKTLEIVEFIQSSNGDNQSFSLLKLTNNVLAFKYSCGNDTSKLFYSQNGIDWDYIGSYYNISAIYKISDNSLYLKTRKYNYFSNDCGKHWYNCDSYIEIKDRINIIGNDVFELSNGRLLVKYKSSDVATNIYYSDDNGKTWNYSKLDGSNFSGNISNIIKLSNGRIIGYHSLNYMYYSDDNGETWNYSTLDGSNFSGCAGTIIELSNSRLLNCGYFYSGGRMYYSDDNGATWNYSTLDGSNLDGSVKTIIELSNGRIIGYVGSSNNSNIATKIYYSDDNGATWNYSTLDGSNFDGYISNIIELSIGNLISYHINNSNGKIYYSNDNGATWNYSTLDGSNFNGYISDIIELSNDKLICCYINNNGKMYYSDDNGATWNYDTLNGSNPNGNIKNIIRLSNNRLIVCTSSSNGVYYSDDNGETWNYGTLNSNKFIGSINTIIELSNSRIIGYYTNGSNTGKIYYSDDNGATWNYSTLDGSNFSEYISNIIELSNGNLICYCANSSNGKMYYSNDNGKTWNYSTLDGSNFNGYIKNIIELSNGRIIGYYTNYANVDIITNIYYSDDNGATWNYGISDELNYVSKYNKIININNNNYLIYFVDKNYNINIISLINGYESKQILNIENNIDTNISVSIYNGIIYLHFPIFDKLTYKKNLEFYSDDNGRTWKRITPIINDEFIIKNYNNMIIKYKTVYDKIYYSDDNGETWNYFSINDENIKVVEYDEQYIKDIYFINNEFYIITNNGIYNKINNNFIYNKLNINFKNKIYIPINEHGICNKVYNFELYKDNNILYGKYCINDNENISDYDIYSCMLIYSNDNGVTWNYCIYDDSLFYCNRNFNNSKYIPINNYEYKSVCNIFKDYSIDDKLKILCINEKTTTDSASYVYETYILDKGKLFKQNGSYFKTYGINEILYKSESIILLKFYRYNTTSSAWALIGIKFDKTDYITAEVIKISSSNFSIIQENLDSNEILITADDDVIPLDLINLSIKYIYYEKKFEDYYNKIIKLSNGRIISYYYYNNTNYGKICYSDDNGATWNYSKKPDGSYFSGNISNIIELSNGNLISYTINGYYNIYYSDDNGATWNYSTLDGSNFKGYISNIIELSNGKMIGYYSVNGNTGKMYYSDDNGATWNYSKKPDGNNFSEYISDIIKLSNGRIIGYYTDSNNNYSGKIFYSDDNGATWNYSTLDGSNFSERFNTIIELSNGNLLCYKNVRGDGVMCYSDDNGTTWNYIKKPDGSYLSGYMLSLIVLMNNRIIINVTKSFRQEIYYSDDNGATWNYSTLDGNNFSVNFKKVLKLSNGRIISYDTKIYYSDDNGATWNYSTLDGSNFSGYFTNIIKLSNSRLIGYYGSSYTYYSDDNGATWNYSKKPDGSNLDEYISNIIELSNGRIIGYYVSIGNIGKIYYSDDNGITWNYSTLDGSNFSGYISNIIELSNGKMIGYYSNGSVYYSDDNGATWNYSKKPDGSNIDGYISDIIELSNGRLIIKPSGKIYYSDDNGATWNYSKLNGSNFNGNISDIIKLSNGRLIYSVYSGNPNCIYYSDDNGATLNYSNCIIKKTDNSVKFSNVKQLVNNRLLATINGDHQLCYNDFGNIIWKVCKLGNDYFESNNLKIIKLSNGRIISYHGSGLTYYSDDNGATWNYSKKPDGSIFSENINAIKELSNGGLIGYGIYSNGSICYSNDNGATWNYGTLDGSNFSGYISNILELSNGGLIGYRTNSSNNSVFYSDDNGATWNYSTLDGSNFSEIISDIIELSNGRIIGYYPYNNGKMYCSDDNGATWNYSKKPDGSYFSGNISKIIELSNSRIIGYYTNNAYGNMYYSDDNGATWNYSKKPDGSNIDGNIKNIIKLSNNRLICYYRVTQTGYDNMCYSDDNGATWNYSTLDGSNFNEIISISDIIKLSNGRIISYSNNGSVCYSDDDGATWNSIIRNGIFFNKDNIILCSDSTHAIIINTDSKKIININKPYNNIFVEENNYSLSIPNEYLKYESMDITKDIKLITDYSLVFNKITKKGYLSNNGNIVTFESVNVNDVDIDFGRCLIENGYKSANIDNDNTELISKNDKIYMIYENDDSLFGKRIDNTSLNDIETNKFTSIKNSRRIYEKLKVINNVSDMKNFTEVLNPETCKNRIVKFINNEIYIIPENSDIKNIVYSNDYYYVLTKVNKIYKLNKDFNVEGILYLDNIKDIYSSDNVFIVCDIDGNCFVDVETIKKHKGFLESANNDTKVLVNILNK